MAKTSEAQRRANHKWTNKNKDKQRLYQYRSNAKKFIKEMANKKDIADFKGLIAQREKQLNDED